MRVLHLIDPGSPGGGACTLRLLAEPRHRLQSVEQDVLILGTRAHANLAQRCGVDAAGVIGAPLGQPAFSRRAVRRTVRWFEQARGQYDLVHAWTPLSAMLALLALPHRRTLATLSVGPVSGLATQVLAALLEHRDMPLLASSGAVHREYSSMGLSGRRLSILPPAVNPESAEPVDRAALRRRWEIGEQTFVVGLLSEPVQWADARIAVNVVARVAATGRDVRLLVHPEAARRPEADRWAARVDLGEIMVVDDEVAEPWRITGGLDAALLIGGELNSMDLGGSGSPFAVLTGGGRRLRPMPGIMPLLWAMSAAVPVIAEASDAVRDVIDEGRTGLLVDQHDINAAADRIIRIHDDPTIAGRIGMQARARVQQDFHVSAYCVRLKELYERMIENRSARVVSDENEPMIERREAASLSWLEE